MLTRRDFVWASSAAAALTCSRGAWSAAPGSEMLLPPAVSAKDFGDALNAMRTIVGRAYVFSDEPQMTGYRDHFALSPPEEHAASGAVAPRNVEEIQRLLKVARDYRVPVWTISTGRNLGYGGAAPRMPGTLVLDLKRMNRIIEVNEKHAYAVVEPGVSYKDLYAHLQRTGSKLWIDCAAPAWGGVVGNLLDRGVGYTPMGEHFLQQQCGMQVVLSDGTVVETGMAGQRGQQGQYNYRYGHGAWVDGLFTQSNFGVVTRLGVQLMPEPPGYRPYMVTFPDEEAIEPLTEAIRPLKLAQIIPNAATSTELLWEAAVEVRKDQYFTGEGPTPASARQKIKDDLGIGEWNFYGALYGPPAVMDATWPVIRDALGSIKGAKFYTAEDKKGRPSFEYRAKLMRGVPNMTEFGTVAWIPNAGHVGFGPVVPVDGKLAFKQYRRIRELTNQAGFDYFGEFIVGWRDMHHIFMPAFDLSDDIAKKKLHDLVGRLIDEAAAEQFGVYRTHLDFMDKVAGTYSWNDGALARFNARLKAAIDPSGILAPGKSGIWPEKAA
ncbi:MAG: oxidoreductase [Sphingomonas bacterium]|nr:FAD-binding oxidoreductase [Sphingomonas bacterium]MDB5688657.1 oxidoreductase [Sphingomonas bacterium]